MRNSKLHGYLLVYWKNGILKRKDLYKEGKLIEGKNWDRNGNLVEYSKFELPSLLKN